MAAPPPPEIPAFTILSAATFLGDLVSKHDALSNQIERGCDLPTRERLDREQTELNRRMFPLEDFIVASQPISVTKAAILLMHAAARINMGNSCEDSEDLVEAGEMAVRRAMWLLAQELRVDLRRFGGGGYYAVAPSLTGEA